MAMMTRIERRLFLAISFMTRLPVPPTWMAKATDQDWRLAAAAFPACGYLLAALTFTWPGLILARFPRLHTPEIRLLLAGLSVALLAWLTRGLHLDGLGDMCDGFGGAYEPEKRLLIMKDSRCGSFAVTGVSLLLLVKAAAVSALFAADNLAACFACVATARFFTVFLAAAGHYPRPTGTGAFLIGKIPGQAILIALVTVVPCILFIHGMLLATLTMLAVTIWLKWRADRLLGGITGDILGAGTELCETAGYIAAALS